MKNSLMNRVFIPKITLASLLLLVFFLLMTCGCASTKVEIAEGYIAVNSRNVVASQTVKPSGEIQTKIDTTNQTWWDRVRTTLDAVGGWIGGLANNTQYTID